MYTLNIASYCASCKWVHILPILLSQIATFMGPTWGPPGSCRPQMGPMLSPWTLLSGVRWWVAKLAINSPQGRWCWDHYVLVSSQWEMPLHCNTVSRWLSAYTGSSQDDVRWQYIRHIYSALSIPRGIFSPKNYKRTSSNSPGKRRYRVCFLSSQFYLSSSWFVL